MLNEVLYGKTIVKTREKRVNGGRTFIIDLDDGSQLKFVLEGDIGADGEWYQFAAVYLNNKKVWRDA